MNTKIDEEFNEAIGRRLSLLRKSQKMSLESLGVMLGVSHQQVHKYETGESSLLPRRIQTCAKIFNVPVGYFYGEDEHTDQYRRFDKSILTIAAELQDLPIDVRKGVYLLSRQINKSLTNSKVQHKEQVA